MATIKKIRVHYQQDGDIVTILGDYTIAGAFNVNYSSGLGEQQGGILAQKIDKYKPAIIALSDSYSNPCFISLKLEGLREGPHNLSAVHATKDHFIQTEYNMDISKGRGSRFMIKIDGQWYGSGPARDDMCSLHSPDLICAHIAGAVNDDSIVQEAHQIAEQAKKLVHEERNLHHAAVLRLNAIATLVKKAPSLLGRRLRTIRDSRNYFYDNVDQHSLQKARKQYAPLELVMARIDDIDDIANRKFAWRQSRISEIRELCNQYPNRENDH